MDVYLSESESDDETLLLTAIVADEEYERYQYIILILYYYTVRNILAYNFYTFFFFSKQKRKCWVHNINKEREVFGEYATLMPQLRADQKRFFIYFRMTVECFDEILGWISDEIYKIPTNFRMPINPSERLAIALR